MFAWAGRDGDKGRRGAGEMMAAVFLHIRYDDRERSPWLLCVGVNVWHKYRTREGAEHGKRDAERLLEMIRDEARR